MEMMHVFLLSFAVISFFLLQVVQINPVVEEVLNLST